MTFVPTAKFFADMCRAQASNDLLVPPRLHQAFPLVEESTRQI